LNQRINYKRNQFSHGKTKEDRYCLSQSKQAKENDKDEEKTVSWLEEKKEKNENKPTDREKEAYVTERERRR
jgi:hypothetical protein